VGLSVAADNSAAEWLVRADVPWEQLVAFGPAGFAAYARLRFIPDPERPGQVEGDVALPEDHPSDIAQARRALGILAKFTATPEQCYFCLWDGYFDPRSRLRRGPLVDLLHRCYALQYGSLTDSDVWEDLSAEGLLVPPAFVWPADRSWCFASDVDPHWAGIGGSQAAIDALLSAPELDVVPARPGEVQPTYY